MFALRMTMRLHGPVDILERDLEEATTPAARARILWKLALSHDPGVITTLAPYLAGAECERVAALRGILHFGEDARAPMLDILADPRRRELHAGALRVLAAIVRAWRPDRLTAAASFPAGSPGDGSRYRAG